MSKKFFVDTNILVYSVDSTEPDKQKRARQWLEILWTQRSGTVSSQVLAEFYDVVTRKLKPGLPRRDAQEIALSYAAWSPVATTHKLIALAFSVQEKWKFGWWDCLVVAAANSSQSDYLLTEDLSDRQVLNGIRVINPFNVSPETIEESE